MPVKSLDWDRCYSINAIQLFNDIDKGIEDILNNFANDATLNGAANTPGGQDDIQGDLEKLKKGAHWNLKRLSQVQVLHKGQGNLQYQHSVQDEQIKSSLAKKWGADGGEDGYDLARWACSPESQLCPVLQ